MATSMLPQRTFGRAHRRRVLDVTLNGVSGAVKGPFKTAPAFGRGTERCSAPNRGLNPRTEQPGRHGRPGSRSRPPQHAGRGRVDGCQPWSRSVADRADAVCSMASSRVESASSAAGAARLIPSSGSNRTPHQSAPKRRVQMELTMEKPPLGPNGFKYRPQFAVIVVCADEQDQKRTFEQLKRAGYERLRVVSV